jgi:hypothetical protein
MRISDDELRGHLLEADVEHGKVHVLSFVDQENVERSVVAEVGITQLYEIKIFLKTGKIIITLAENVYSKFQIIFFEIMSLRKIDKVKY